MNIEGKKTEINKSAETIYNFLSNFDNFNKLMPPQVENFKSEGDNCSFTISGLPELKLSIVEKRPNSYIEISSGSSVQFEIKLIVNIEPNGDSQSMVQIVFKSDISGMYSMMLKSPLEKFVNTLTEKLRDINI